MAGRKKSVIGCHEPVWLPQWERSKLSPAHLAFLSVKPEDELIPDIVVASTDVAALSATRRGKAISTAHAAAALAKFLSGNPTVEAPAQLRSELRSIAELAFEDDSNLQTALQLIEAIFDGSAPDAARLGLDTRNTLLAANLIKFSKIVAPLLDSFPRVPVMFIGAAEDCLADSVDDWSVFRLLNLAAMSSVRPRKKVAIVTSVRNEGLSVVEWLAFHRSIGFEDFFVYTNDNSDESDQLLTTLARHGVIRLIVNRVSPGVRVQAKILEHSLQLLPELRDFEWGFYIDVDEFFMPRCEPGLTLESFFRDFERTFTSEAPSAIAFNWKWFGSENAFEFTAGLLLERFTHSIHNEHVKSLVRLRDTVTMKQVHVPRLVDGAWLVNSNFERVDPAIHMQPSYGRGQINHYWNKSFQEFVLKRARGRISAALGAPPLDFSTFFEWGANGRRGNFDPPQGRILERVHAEYATLLALPGVECCLNTVRLRCDELLCELDAQLNIGELYQRHGVLVKTGNNITSTAGKSCV